MRQFAQKSEFEALPDCDSESDKLQRKEFDIVVKKMKKGKVTGMDEIPAEV